MASNAIQVIFPYCQNSVWMFDDESKGLAREPFVSGIPEMIDILVADIKDARKGFALYFSEQPFPRYGIKAELVAPEGGGNWYKVVVNGVEMQGWLCGALFRYFDAAPATIYAKAEALRPLP
jgi:hypothetical protein